MNGERDHAVAREAALRQLAASLRHRFRTTEDMVCSVLRNAIAAGVLKPGERLPQDRLAGLLQVSRMPIRAALRQLESEGLVELHPHRGARVRALGSQELSDLYEMRIMIETFALRKTVAVATDDEIRRLDVLADRLEGGDEDWLEASQRFYRALYSIGNTPRVVTTIMQFRAEVARYTMDLHEERSKTHRDLLDRVRGGDPQAAAEWLEAHLRSVAAAIRRKLQTGEG